MLKSTEEKKKKKKEEISKAIIDSAIPLIHDRTFTQISIQEFCESAGITTGMFYRHFKTKNELLSIVYTQESKITIEKSLERTTGLPLDQRLIDLGISLCRCSQLLGPDGLLMYLNTDKDGVEWKESRFDIERAVEVILESEAARGESLPEGKTATEIGNDIALLLKAATFEWYSWREEFDIDNVMVNVFKRFMPAILNN